MIELNSYDSTSRFQFHEHDFIEVFWKYCDHESGVLVFVCEMKAVENVSDGDFVG